MRVCLNAPVSVGKVSQTQRPHNTNATTTTTTHTSPTTTTTSAAFTKPTAHVFVRACVRAVPKEATPMAVVATQELAATAAAGVCCFHVHAETNVVMCVLCAGAVSDSAQVPLGVVHWCVCVPYLCACAWALCLTGCGRCV